MLDDGIGLDLFEGLLLNTRTRRGAAVVLHIRVSAIADARVTLLPVCLFIEHPSISNFC